MDDIDTIVFSSQSAHTLNKFRDLAGNPGAFGEKLEH